MSLVGRASLLLLVVAGGCAGAGPPADGQFLDPARVPRGDGSGLQLRESGFASTGPLWVAAGTTLRLRDDGFAPGEPACAATLCVIGGLLP
jgi:hypothetical protein